MSPPPNSVHVFVVNSYIHNKSSANFNADCYSVRTIAVFGTLEEANDEARNILRGYYAIIPVVVGGVSISLLDIWKANGTILFDGDGCLQMLKYPGLIELYPKRGPSSSEPCRVMVSRTELYPSTGRNITAAENSIPNAYLYIIKTSWRHKPGEVELCGAYKTEDDAHEAVVEILRAFHNCLVTLEEGSLREGFSGSSVGARTARIEFCEGLEGGLGGEEELEKPGFLITVCKCKLRNRVGILQVSEAGTV